MKSGSGVTLTVLLITAGVLSLCKHLLVGPRPHWEHSVVGVGEAQTEAADQNLEPDLFFPANFTAQQRQSALTRLLGRASNRVGDQNTQVEKEEVKKEEAEVHETSKSGGGEEQPLAAAEPPQVVPFPLDLDTALKMNIPLECVHFGDSGFCSQTNHLIARLVYSKHPLLLDTRGYYMQYDDHTGVIGGYFEPAFPLIQNDQDNNKLPNPLSCQKANWGKFRSAYAKKFKKQTGGKPSLAPPPGYKPDYDFYAMHAKAACQNFRFNQHTKEQLANRRIELGIPDFADPKTGTSVAFHVRRGDKVGTESRLILGEEYVARLQQVIPAEDVNQIKHCFVATDAYAAVNEIAVALANHNIKCQVHTFTRETEGGHDANMAHGGMYSRNTWDEFFAEMSMLIDATYFVAAMNSNVARFVELLRYCAHPDAPNFHHSYDVESIGWYPL